MLDTIYIQQRNIHDMQDSARQFEHAWRNICVFSDSVGTTLSSQLQMPHLYSYAMLCWSYFQLGSHKDGLYHNSSIERLQLGHFFEWDYWDYRDFKKSKNRYDSYNNYEPHIRDILAYCIVFIIGQGPICVIYNCCKFVVIYYSK